MISRRSTEQAIGIAVLAVLAAGCFLVLRPFLPAILWAVVLAFATRPLYERLVRALGGRSTLAAALMIVAALAVLVAPFAAAAWTMSDDLARLTAIVQGWFERGLPPPPAWVASIPLLGARLSTRWQELASAGERLPAELAPYLGIVRNWLLIVAAGLANALFELVLSLLIAFFLFRHGPAAGQLLVAITERLTGARARRLIGIAASTIRGVVDGLIGANLAQAVLAGIGFALAGVPGALLLGFLVFFLTVIPFGAGLVWVPAVLWVWHAGHTTTAVILAIWCVLVFPVLENVVRPYLVQRGSDLPGLLILLGMLGGLSTFGFLGVFLGPLLLALAYTLVVEWGADGADTARVAGDGERPSG